jgi:hypothetical protein
MLVAAEHNLCREHLIQKNKNETSKIHVYIEGRKVVIDKQR